MNNFDKIIIFQMMLYWIIVPILSFAFRDYIYPIYFIIPYFFLILFYFFVANKNKINKDHFFRLSSNDNRIFIIIILLIIYMLISEGFGRMAFGQAQNRNASFTIFEAIIHKICEISFYLFFAIQVNKSNLKKINIIIMFLCIVGSFIYTGASKSNLIIFFMIFLTFNNIIKFTPKIIFLCTTLVISIMIVVFKIRGEQESLGEIFEYFTERLDGIRLVSEDPLGEINYINFPKFEYLYSLFFSIFRFINEDILEDFSAGLVSVKSIYLFKVGHTTLDTVITFPSELIIIAGYIPGLVISIIVLLALRRYAFNKIFSPGVLNFSIGYSIINSIFVLERSVISYLIDPIKIFPIVFILIMFIARVNWIKNHEA